MKRAVIAVAMICAVRAPALAQEPVKAAIGQGGNLEALITEIGTKGGVFARHNLKPEVLYTSGGGETLQATVSGSVEFGVSIGTSGALAAGQKGAPIRIVGSTSFGSPVYWYVKQDSPIRDMKDIAGKKLSFSTVGSGTHAVALLVKSRGIDAQLVATGNLGSTYTAVMTGQVDVGAAPPEFGQKPLARGDIRIVFRDNDFDRINAQSLRALVVNASVSEDKIARFTRAYKETVDWVFSGDPAPIRLYAQLLGVGETEAKELADGFWSQKMLDPVKVRGVSLAMEDAINAKMLPGPLTPEQLDRLIAPAARE